jgi:hypothetical protein
VQAAKNQRKGDFMSRTLLGAWGSFSFTITPEAKKAFDQALEGLVGVQYTPLAFAIQVVNGLNYCFLCEGKVVVPEQPEIAALIYIYAPFDGVPHITDITRINP